MLRHSLSPRFLSSKGLLVSSCLFIMVLLSGCGLFSGDVPPPAEGDDALFAGDPVPYSVTFRVVHPKPPQGEGQSSGNLSGEKKTDEANREKSSTPGAGETQHTNTAPVSQNALSGVSDDEILSLMRSNSMLEQLLNQPPDSLLGLERRARSDQETAIKVLRSFGFYDGRARFRLDKKSTPAKVTFDLIPGTRYVVGNLDIAYEPSPVIPEAFQNRTFTTGFLWKEVHKLRPPSFPLRIRGLEKDMPASAGPILDAIENWPNRFKNYGYPFARVASSRYFLDKEQHTLTVQARLDPGPAATMGELQFSGLENVGDTYLRRLVPWRPDTPWSDRLLERYRTNLLETGLFRSVEVHPVRLEDLESSAGNTTEAKKEESPPSSPSEGSYSNVPLELPIAVELREMAFRTVGASLRYSTDMGMGVQGSWEHRNFFGNGEQMTVDGTLAEDEQGIKLDFTKPAFLRADQKLLAGGHIGRKITDAYTAREVRAYGGLERKLAPFWWGGFLGGLVQGEIDEGYGPDAYEYVFMEFGIRRDTRNNALNPTRGSRFTFSLAPYEGRYLSESFSMIMPRMEFSTYYRPFRSDRVVLAARLAAGGMFGAHALEVPATLRYYVGGGGSVRGYAYQAIGPRNSHGDPEGATSFQEINLELRFKITENIGIVPFLDGGMVYESSQPDWGKDLDWGTGLGLRYYTPVGPLRVDFGVPLTKISGEKNYQIYISLGQSF